MSASTTTDENQITTGSVIEILSSELSSIAREIEELPEIGFAEITQEQMIWMQQIDFCSQRLAEVSKLIRQLKTLEDASQENLQDIMRAEARLEHVRNLFG